MNKQGQERWGLAIGLGVPVILLVTVDAVFIGLVAMETCEQISDR